MISTQYINLNMTPSGALPVLHCSQYDVGRPLGVVVYNGSEAVDLSQYTVTIEATRTDGTPITAAVTTDGNIGAFATTATMTNKDDLYPAQLVIVDGDSNRVASLPFMMRVVEAAMDENSEAIEEDASLYQQYTGTVQSIIAAVRADLNAEALARTAADIALQNNINAEADTRTSRDTVLQAQIDQLVAPTGTAPSAAEVENARIDADGVTHATLGEAIRTQETSIKSALSAISPSPVLTWTLGKGIDSTGAVANNRYTAASNALPCSGGDVVIRLIPNQDNNTNPRTLLFYVAQYRADGSFISRTSVEKLGDLITLDPFAASVRFAFGRTSGTGITIAQSDIDTYFDYRIYRRAVMFTDYDAEAMIYRGTISSLGYTTVAACNKQGYYTFTGSDTISDLPDGWEAGGLITVYVTGSNIWQSITNNYATYQRYNTGVWYNSREEKLKVAYTSGAGENDSTEQLKIYIPRNKATDKAMYQMGHCVKSADNADVWRIMFAYRVTGTNGYERKLTMTGEWECALHLDGRNDFSGGIVHGDEVDTSVTAFVDGTLTNISDLNVQCDELKIVRRSNLYDPNDHTTIIAEHGVEYIYTKAGLTINQSVKWKVTATLTNCFLAMLPVLKAYSLYRYDDTNFDIVENDQTSYAVTIPDAASVTEYSTAYDCSFTIKKSTYPSGLTGGDCALVTDNNGLNYNKVYFPVCTSGTVQSGTLWKATVTYSNK